MRDHSKLREVVSSVDITKLEPNGVVYFSSNFLKDGFSMRDMADLYYFK